MSTPINDKSGFVSKPTVPGKSKETPTAVNPKTGFVSKPTSSARPANPTLTPPESKP